MLTLEWWTTPGYRKFAGHNGVISFMSELAYVNGLQFIILSTSTRAVVKTSRSCRSLVSMKWRCFFNSRTRRSHTPPQWGACGGPKRHSMPRSKRALVFTSLHSFTARFNSLSLPLNVVPLSLTRVRRPGRRAWNRISAFKQVPDFISRRISK